MMIIENTYDIGDMVYLATDRDQSLRMIIAVVVYKQEIMYKVICGTSVSSHYDFELSVKKNVLATL